MKLHAPAPRLSATLALGLALAASASLLPCADLLSSDASPPLATPSALANEPPGEPGPSTAASKLESATAQFATIEDGNTGDSTQNATSSAEPTNSEDPPNTTAQGGEQGGEHSGEPPSEDDEIPVASSPPITVEPSDVGRFAPGVVITTPASDLGFLLNDGERAAIAANPSTPVSVRLVSTPMIILSLGAPPTSQGPSQSASPQLTIDLANFLVLTTAAERLYNYSSNPGHKSGYFPFDLALELQVGDASKRQLTGPIGGEIAVSLTLTDELVAAIREQNAMDEAFTFAVFHGVTESEGLRAEQCGGVGDQDHRTLEFALSSFSPFIIAWGDTPPLAPPSPPAGSVDPGSTGTGGSTGGTVIDTPDPSTPDPTPPTTPASPSTPEPAPVPSDPASPEDPAPSEDSSATAALPSDPFLAWSPAQTRSTVTLRWTQVRGADGYLIYRCRCSSGGVRRTPRLATVLGPGARSWTYRGLASGRWFKHRVEAFRLVDGKREVIARSPLVHASTLGGKSRVASGVLITSVRGSDGAAIELRKPEGSASGGAVDSVNVASAGVASGDGNASSEDIELGSLQVLELSTGEQVQLTARELGRKLTVHHRGMRFASTDAAVANVTNSGQLIANAPGSCRVWAYAQSGIFHMIEVRVA